VAVRELGPKAADMAESLLLRQGAIKPITAYHGTPHKVDKFSMDKIGTGEGAQVYGHGLYFADDPKVAKYYSEVLPLRTQTIADKFNVDGKPVSKIAEELGASKIAADRVTNALSTTKNNVESARKFLKAVNVLDADAESLFQKIGGKDIAWNPDWDKSVTGGNLYTVDIPDEAVANMLLWDKPLSQQPEAVQKVISEEIKRIGGSAHTGQQAYKELMFDARMNGTASRESVLRDNIEQVAASNRLKELGIPGIRYLDQGSRGAGSGTMNTVVFDENLIKILEENGMPVRGLLSD
jgi:hypothetical protein